MCSCNQEEDAIDVNEEIPFGYQGWHCSHMEEEEEPPHASNTPIPAPIQHHELCEVSSLEHRSKSKETLSQILAIPRFVSTKEKRRTNALYGHNKLITSESYAAEIKAKEDKDVAIKLALQEKKKAKQEETHRKKQEKEEKWIDNMVKKWIKEMEETDNID